MLHLVYFVALAGSFFLIAMALIFAFVVFLTADC